PPGPGERGERGVARRRTQQGRRAGSKPEPRRRGSGNMDCCKGEGQGSLKNRLKRLYDMGFHHPSAVRSATHTGRVANTPRSPTRNTSWDASWWANPLPAAYSSVPFNVPPAISPGAW